MSKSLGNVIVPQKVMSTLGADVLRLWIAATDYANEMALSDEILKRMSDSYRRMRNTVRFLLGNLAGFDPAADARAARRRWWRSIAGRWRAPRAARGNRRGVSQVRVPPDLPEDAQLLRRGPGRVLSRRAQGPAVHHAEEERRRAARRRPRCSTSPRAWCAGSRRSCRFTADEIWSFLPGKRSESVFLETWHALPKVRGGSDRLEPVHPAQGRGGAGARKAARRRHHRRLARRRGRSVQQGRVPREAQGAGRGAALPADHLRGAR